MKITGRTMLVSVLVITLASCNVLATKRASLPGPGTAEVTIINHERPNIQVDFFPFKNSGCKLFSSNSYHCQPSSLLYTLGCTYIEETPLLGGLTPEYPIATCILEINEDAGVADIPDSCFYYDGGFTTYCYQYVVYKDHHYQLLKTIAEFRALYAPVDSPEEALGFVLVSDNFIAEYGQTKNNDYIYSVQELEDTHVETVAGGYVVHVFDTPGFGCEPFETKSVEIKVTYDGQLTELNRFPVYGDSSLSGCVD